MTSVPEPRSDSEQARAQSLPLFAVDGLRVDHSARDTSAQPRARVRCSQKLR